MHVGSSPTLDSKGKMGIKETLAIEANIDRMMKELGLDHLLTDASRSYARAAIEANPKSVEKYFAGKSALSEMVGWAMKESRGSVNPHLVGEWIVFELVELHRSRLRARKEEK